MAGQAEEPRELALLLRESRRTLAELAHRMQCLAEAGKAEGELYRQLRATHQQLQDRVRRGTGVLAARDADASPGSPLLATPGIGLLGHTLGAPRGKDKPDEVRNLQQLLAALGLAVPVSGTFDQATRAAVCQFQARHRLPANGIVGAETRRVLNSLARATAPPR